MSAPEHMVDSGVRGFPVVDGDGRVLGMLSRNYLMTAIGGEVLA